MADSDEDLMADLFSFGSDEMALSPTNASSSTSPLATSNATLPAVSAAPYRSNSDEEFLDLLEDSPELLSGPSVLSTTSGGHHDAETQEILAWLDEEKPTVVESAETTLDEQAEKEAPDKPNATASPPPAPVETVVSLPPVFKSLTSALASTQATVGQVRRLATEHLDDITHLNRPDLYCRLLTGKSLNATQSQSSLVDAFTSWQSSEARKDEIAPHWMQLASEALAERVAESLEKTHATHRDKEACRQDLLDVLQYHVRGLPKPEDESSDEKNRDWFIPPVAAAFLGFSVPAPVASVLLNQVIGQHMPVLALQPSERWEAAQGLHQHLYWLSCYHLPLLVFHLDRYWPGWCAPRIPEDKENTAPTTAEAPTAQARHLEQRGLVPPSWLVSLLAGDATFLPTTWMGQVWDWIMTASNRSVPFFLTLAVLERAADNLILLTGDDLRNGFVKAFEFTETSDWLENWWEAAKALQTATPVSVLEQLEKAEDEAVQQAVVRRQERAEAALAARLEAEKQAHIEEQERKAEEARRRLNRARLVAFYRTHAPDKEGNIDQILENYGDRLEVLEAKLFKKYGESFNPALSEKQKEKSARGPNKLLATMNQGLVNRRSITKEQEEAPPTDQIEAPAASKTDQVAVLVKAEEVLPVVCWSKEAAAIRGANRRSRIADSSGVPLKFFVVDSRSDEAAEEQGRFPTAISLSPETMLDPEKLLKSEERFESLRGTVHIVVMGEGFSAIPKLYDQKLSTKLEEAMKQDDSRTNICALFFFKKGFPFVSILDGGFAAAHSWLVREGPNFHLDVTSVLVDYNAENSLFGQMEKLHTASATEKASRAMQNLMEKSLVAMTIQARQLEKLASDMESGRGRFGMSFLTTRTKTQTSDRSKSNDENKGPRFANPFANKSTEEPGEPNAGPRFSKIFSRQKSADIDAEATPTKLSESTSEGSSGGAVPFRNPFARKQEAEDEKSSDGTTEGISSAVPFRNPFAARKQETDGEKPSDQAAPAPKTTTENSSTSSDAGAKLAMSNPFKGLGAAINNQVNRNSDKDGAVQNNSGESKPALSNPFKGLGAALNRAESSSGASVGAAALGETGSKQSASMEPTAAPSGEKRNMFGGLGNAFNSATKVDDKNKTAASQGTGAPAVPNMLKRNPFRGFGGNKKEPDDGNNKKAGGFGGGFNTFRTSFARGNPAGKGQEDTGGNDESITFD